MGCGGLLGVNAGSAEPPVMVRLTYRPAGGEPAGHLALVGKGIMYDSGGLSLKPGDEVHAQMKNDMSGAAAVLAAMSVARATSAAGRAVTGYLMCTDNMPSGHGDGARRRAHDPRRHDGRGHQHRRRGPPGDGRRARPARRGRASTPIVDIATLTGAAMRALGRRRGRR